MSVPVLLIVTGPPAAGKTTLAIRLASDLSVPLLAKDGFKEVLFDALGTGTTAWSRHLGAASFDLLFHAVGALLGAGVTCMIEANFDAERSLPAFQRLQGAHRFRPIQIVCAASPATLAARYAARHVSGTRHPGHHTARLDDPEALLVRHRSLALDGPVLSVNNESERTQGYATLLVRVRNEIEKADRDPA